MRKRDIRLEDYGVSKRRYLELFNFVKQYNEWKEELREKQDTVGSPNFDGMPKGTSIGDSTEKLALRRELLSRKCRVVDEALEEAASDLAPYLKKYLCDGVSYAYLEGTLQIPCSYNAFYDLKRWFFVILDEKVDRNF